MWLNKHKLYEKMFLIFEGGVKLKCGGTAAIKEVYPKEKGVIVRYKINCPCEKKEEHTKETMSILSKRLDNF